MTTRPPLNFDMPASTVTMPAEMLTWLAFTVTFVDAVIVMPADSSVIEFPFGRHGGRLRDREDRRGAEFLSHGRSARLGIPEQRRSVEHEWLRCAPRMPDELISEEGRPFVGRLPALDGLRFAIRDPVLADALTLVARA